MVLCFFRKNKICSDIEFIYVIHNLIETKFRYLFYYLHCWEDQSKNIN